MQPQPVNLIGAGLAGALLALVLARKGFPVQVFERRPHPDSASAEHGRSINLALAARGIQALERVGIMAQIRPLLIPLRGRMVHERSGSPTFHPYGQRAEEVIYSVGRAPLNRQLLQEASRHPGVCIRFDQACLGADPSRNVLRFRDGNTNTEHEVPLARTIATDGAGSAVRSSLAFGGQVSVQEEFLDHDYKELTIVAQASGPALERHALHIWPRGGFMLIALPNTDGSFTATLFLARKGENSFASLATAQAVEEFFLREFPDVIALIPDLLAAFRDHPQGQLGTVHASPFNVDGRVLLLGDAAHAIVPFHGQGMNAAFEDCAVFDSLLERHDDWGPLFAEFSRIRRPDAEAIARMALENYTEMRQTVLDSKFVRQRQLALELERRFPQRFIPRYAMVMFHPEISYSEALRRGIVQARILDELDAVAQVMGQLDLAMAQRLISAQLAPLVS